ncbi:MAG: hypothetical protein GY755_04955 [Chloroflexi bacterium]|nr:hypothetical protein [Chloroflexota bacterium]
MRRSFIGFFLFLIIALSACAPLKPESLPLEHPSIIRDTETEKTLKLNRALWEKQAAENYQYTLAVFCNCPSEFDEPVIIRVQNGEAVSIKNTNSSAEMESDLFSAYDTIDELFDVIQLAIERGADEIKVNYDSDYGYPINISIDYDLEGIDDEEGYTISNVEIR